MPSINNFGTLLKDLRIVAKKNISDMEEFLGIDDYYDYESNKKGPFSFEDCKKIEGFLGVEGEPLFNLSKVLYYKQYFTPGYLCEYIISEFLEDDDIEILEPGCGSGNFLKHLPDGINVTAVEKDQYLKKDLDKIISKKGYNCDLIINDFLEHDFGEKKFDLVIGNPPFGYQKEKKVYLDIEFVKKSIELIKDTGSVVFLLEGKFVFGLRRFNEIFKELACIRSMHFLVRRPHFNEYSGTGTRDCTIFEFRKKKFKGDYDIKWVEFSADGRLLSVR